MGEGRCCRVVGGIEGGVWAAELKGEGTSGAHESSIAPVASSLSGCYYTCQVAYPETKETQLIILQLCAMLREIIVPGNNSI